MLLILIFLVMAILLVLFYKHILLVEFWFCYAVLVLYVMIIFYEMLLCAFYLGLKADFQAVLYTLKSLFAFFVCFHVKHHKM